MAKEIERKFLVKDDSYRLASCGSVEIAQGYLSCDPDRTVRVRLAGSRGLLTVKTRVVGLSRDEWEYEIPAIDARQMLDKAAVGVIEKTRYFVPADNCLMWEIDCFHGALEGLKLAEIEIPDEGTPICLPEFIGEEVTGDPCYYNSNLGNRT